MSKLAIQAEIGKLAHTLDVDPETLHFLVDIPEKQLQDMRAAVYELMFHQDRKVVQQLARLAGRLPVRWTALLSEHAFGPAVTGRIASELPAKRAAQVITRLPAAFIADVAMYVDPRRVRDLIGHLSVDLIVSVALEMAERDDFITMSRYVDFVSDEMLQAVVNAIEDEGKLLRLGFFMESKTHLDHVFRMLPAERIQRMLQLVADESQDVLDEFLSLLIHVSYGFKRELGDLTAAQDEAVLTRYVRTTQEQGLWPDVFPVVAAMSEPSQRKMVNLAVLREPAVQESIIAAADEYELWGMVLPFVAMMDDANREAVAEIIAGRSRTTLKQAADAALMGEYWEPLIDLVRRTPPGTQTQFAEIVQTYGTVDPDLLGRIVDRARKYGFGESFDALGVTFTPRPASEEVSDGADLIGEQAQVDGVDWRRHVRLERRQKRRAHYRIARRWEPCPPVARRRQDGRKRRAE